MTNKEKAGYIASILCLFVAAGTITATDAKKAEAGVPTADSSAWANDGLTGEIGLDYRTYNKPAVRTETRTRNVIDTLAYTLPPIPAYVDDHGVHIPEVPARHVEATYKAENYHVSTPFTQRINNTSGSGKISGRPFGPDVLVGIGYGGKLYGYTAIKNGNLVGSVGATAFNFNPPQVFGSIAYSPIKNTAVFADFRQGQTSYGLQQQMGDAYVYGAYSPKTNGYAVGIGLEIGSKGETPKAIAVSPPPPAPNDDDCEAGYKMFQGGCAKKVAAPIINMLRTPVLQPGE